MKYALFSIISLLCLTVFGAAEPDKKPRKPLDIPIDIPDIEEKPKNESKEALPTKEETKENDGAIDSIADEVGVEKLIEPKEVSQYFSDLESGSHLLFLVHKDIEKTVKSYIHFHKREFFHRGIKASIKKVKGDLQEELEDFEKNITKKKVTHVCVFLDLPTSNNESANAVDELIGKWATQAQTDSVAIMMGPVLRFDSIPNLVFQEAAQRAEIAYLDLASELGNLSDSEYFKKKKINARGNEAIVKILQKRMGIYPSLIGRSLLENERVLYYSMVADHQSNFDKDLSDLLKAAGGGSQVFLTMNSGDRWYYDQKFEAEDYDRIYNQTPTVVIVHWFQRFINDTAQGKNIAKIPMMLDKLAAEEKKRKANYKTIVFTPLISSDGSKIDPKSQGTKQVEQAADLIKKAAQKHGWEVVDLYQKSLDYLTIKPDAVFYKVQDKSVTAGPDGLKLIRDSMAEIFGLPQ